MSSESADLPKPLRNLIKSCRQKCSYADFTGALEVLKKPIDVAGDILIIKSENVRVHILKGDLKAARTVLEGAAEPDPNNENENYQSLLRIQKAFVDVNIDGTLVEALHTCSDLWTSCVKATDKNSEVHPEVLVRITIDSI